MIALPMKMPDNCNRCRFQNSGYYCVADGHSVGMAAYQNIRDKDCPLRETSKFMSRKIIPTPEDLHIPPDELEREATRWTIIDLLSHCADHGAINCSFDNDCVCGRRFVQAEMIVVPPERNKDASEDL